jgi:hypothetical protein
LKLIPEHLDFDYSPISLTKRSIVGIFIIQEYSKKNDAAWSILEPKKMLL